MGFILLGFATPPTGATAVGDAPYVIGANDKIEVFVWKHNDLSMLVDVTADGHVQYPLVGSIPAVGLTPDELAAQIAERLRSYIVEPKVSVIPRNFDRPVVFVVGQVRNPGSHAYRDQARLSDYLAVAGGPTDDAKLSSVTISRKSDGHPVSFQLDAGRLFELGDPSIDLVLSEGDVVYVPKSFTLLDTRVFVLIVSSLIGIAVGLGRVF